MYFQNSFSIPDEGEEGYIEEKSENSEVVMTVIKGDTGDENEVPIIQLKPKNDLFSHEQMWVRSMICDNGYFTLENPSSGAVFTACYGPWSKIKEYRECEYEGINWVCIIIAYASASAGLPTSSFSVNNIMSMYWIIRN